MGDVRDAEAQRAKHTRIRTQADHQSRTATCTRIRYGSEAWYWSDQQTMRSTSEACSTQCEQFASREFMESREAQGVKGRQTDRRERQTRPQQRRQFLARSQQTQRWMIQETRSQKSGPTVGEKSGPTAGKKEHSQQQAKRAPPTAGEEQCQRQARTRTSSCVTSGQNVIEVTDKVAVVPITTQRQVPTTQWLRKSRRPR